MGTVDEDGQGFFANLAASQIREVGSYYYFSPKLPPMDLRCHAWIQGLRVVHQCTVCTGYVAFSKSICIHETKPQQPTKVCRARRALICQIGKRHRVITQRQKNNTVIQQSRDYLLVMDAGPLYGGLWVVGLLGGDTASTFVYQPNRHLAQKLCMPGDEAEKGELRKLPFEPEHVHCLEVRLDTPDGIGLLPEIDSWLSKIFRLHIDRCRFGQCIMLSNDNFANVK